MTQGCQQSVEVSVVYYLVPKVPINNGPSDLVSGNLFQSLKGNWGAW